MQRVLLPSTRKYNSDPYREGKMGYMKTEDIKALNEIGFTTTELEAWVIMATNLMGGQTYHKSDEYVANEIIDRLRAYDELKIRFKYLEKKHEDLYERLTAFAEKLGDSSA